MADELTREPEAEICADANLLVSVATYNERENLPALWEALRRVCPHASLLVVDDNSPDGTGRWAQQQAEHDERLRVIIRSGKLGLGSAILVAMQTALAEGFEFFAHLDADGSHNPTVIPLMLAHARQPPDATQSGCDCVIGSRYVPGGKVEGWSWARKWMSWSVNSYARWLLRLPVRDCSSGFRLYRTAALRRLDLSCVRAQGYAFLEEILWHLHRTGATFREVPITFVNRQRGHSKINWREAVAAVWHINRLAMRRHARRANRRSTSTPRANSSSDAA